MSDGSTKTCILLVGAGVVGRAILAEHVRRGLNVLLCDLSEPALQHAADEMTRSFDGCRAAAVASPLPGLAALRLGQDLQGDWQPEILIESIPENLALKQSFFASAVRVLPPECILGSNTSNLRIEEVFCRIDDAARCLGSHFFMPVGQRPLVELVPRASTSAETLQRCREHARRLDKDSLVTRDSPGFVVNRMLVPYLNQSLLLLGRGASPDAVARAAERFGMPLSPLELIDLIGIRTAFDSGRVFWQSFPKRIDPAPILSGMIKAGRLGAAFGGGFLDTAPGPPPGDGPESASLAPLHPAAAAVIQRYQRDPRDWNDEEILASLSLPMWIEAAEILAAGVVDSLDAIERGLRGGLGYQHPSGFFGFFDRQGSRAILAQLAAAADRSSLAAPAPLCEALHHEASPSDALRRAVRHDPAAATGTQP